MSVTYWDNPPSTEAQLATERKQLAAVPYKSAAWHSHRRRIAVLEGILEHEQTSSTVGIGPATTEKDHAPGAHNPTGPGAGESGRQDVTRSCTVRNSRDAEGSESVATSSETRASTRAVTLSPGGGSAEPGNSSSGGRTSTGATYEPDSLSESRRSLSSVRNARAGVARERDASRGSGVTGPTSIKPPLAGMALAVPPGIEATDVSVVKATSTGVVPGTSSSSEG